MDEQCNDGHGVACNPSGVGRVDGVQCVVRDGPASGVTWCVSCLVLRPQSAPR